MNIRRVTLCILVFNSHFQKSLQYQCPLGNPGTVSGTYCYSGATCATFDGVEKLCNGYANDRCATGQYRDFYDCSCNNCPANTGSLCTRENECCSLNDCSREHTPVPSDTPLVVTRSLSESTSPCVSKSLICIILGVVVLVVN